MVIHCSLTHCVQIYLFVSLYCKAKLIPTRIWMRHSFHQNFLTNSLVLSIPLLFASGDCDLINSPLYFVDYFYILHEIKENFNNLLNCSSQRQKAVDLKEPVNLWENFDGISISFNSLQRVLWPYNKVKWRSVFGHSVVRRSSQENFKWNDNQFFYQLLFLNLLNNTKLFLE